MIDFAQTYDHYRQTESLDRYVDLMYKLHEKHFKTSELDVSHRQISHWLTKGLFNDERDKDGAWNRFSTLEYIWVRIIMELRAFDYSLHSINLLKQGLVDPIPPDHLKKLLNTDHEIKDESPSILAYTTTDFIRDRGELYLLVFPKGEYLIIDKTRWDDYPVDRLREIFATNHLSINLTAILSELVTRDEQMHFPDFQLLSKQEQAVLDHIRKMNLKSLTVRFDENQNITLLEATEKLDKVALESRYIDHVLKGGYQDISFVTQDGKIAHFERTTKTKL